MELATESVMELATASAIELAMELAMSSTHARLRWTDHYCGPAILI